MYLNLTIESTKTLKINQEMGSYFKVSSTTLHTMCKYFVHLINMINEVTKGQIINFFMEFSMNSRPLVAKIRIHCAD
jgi:hypothetical protein